MNSPIFKDVSQQIFKECLCDPLVMSMTEKANQQVAHIIKENSEALVSAWLAETGHMPKDSVICSQFIGSKHCIWVETREENDKRERA